jgi:radical SAM superfamily enzyme YgiQ (UPF0313 family)
VGDLMKVLLIAPARLSNLRETKSTIPTHLLYLASALRLRNHIPMIYDFSIITGITTDTRGDLPDDLDRLINTLSPDLFAINCFTSQHFPFVTHIAHLLRKKYPEVRTVVGGAHPSLFPEEILANCPDIDYIIIGEGEEQICLLADELSNKISQIDLSHVQSFAWRKEGEIIIQPRLCYLADLDSLPDPAWDLINIADYHSDYLNWNNPKNLLFKVAVPILSSRGCPFLCNFCVAHCTMGRKLRLRSPERVVNEIQMLHERYGENYFSFLDDNINVNKNHILKICSEIVHRGLNIEFETLSGLHIDSLDEDIIEALDQAGCVFVRLGIEHGNDRIRNEIIGKKLDRQKIYDICKTLKNHPNIRIAGMFIMGFPEDTCATLNDTRQMIHDLQLDYNQVSSLLPFPGSRVFKQALTDGILLHNFNTYRLWAGDICLDPTESEFSIKPYEMSIDELKEYRKLFDKLKILPNSRLAQSSEIQG